MTSLDLPKSLTIPDPRPLDHNPAAVYLASLGSHHSRRTMSTALRTVVALLVDTDLCDVSEAMMLSLDWSQLRYQHTAAIRSRLMGTDKSPATINRILAALKGVMKEAWRLGYISAEDYQRAVDIDSVKGETVPAGRELAQGEILALVEACKADETPAGIRDAAVIGLLCTCGLRRAEIVGLDVEDFDPDTGRLLIRSGKGKKQRTVYVRGGAFQALVDWLATRNASGPLFIPILKGGRITERRMSDQAIYDLLKKRANQANVKDFSPHDLRRTFVGEMLERGVDISTVADIAGHSNVETTRRYDRRPETVKRDAAEKLHFPY